MDAKFQRDVAQAYAKNHLPHFTLGGIIFGQKPYPLPVNIVLKNLNRHGLISGATGTGKTKTIQMICEQLSLQGIPSMVMDIKGDLSGLAVPGVINDAIDERCKGIGLTYHPSKNPVEFLSLSNEPGLKLRATVSEFGPLLLAKMLNLNATQSDILTLIFDYAQNQKIPIVDLEDLQALLRFCLEEGRQAMQQRYGGLASQSLRAVFRKTIALHAEISSDFFSEPSFCVHDLVQKRAKQGVISVLRLLDLQSKPRLFSSFMLGLLSEIYDQFPEVGDCERPKLMIFIDEAHLIFDQASKLLMQKLETMVKLIRSKGVGIVFCTQSPTDVPQDILSQLGFKIQHALRAFTAKDRKAIRLMAQNFPLTAYYDTETLLTELGVGEALVTALDESAKPSPLVACLLRPPCSRMGPLEAEELLAKVNQSTLAKQYSHRQAKKQALAVLSEKLKHKQGNEASSTPKKEKSPTGALERLSKNTLFRRVVMAIVKSLTQILEKALGLKGRR